MRLLLDQMIDEDVAMALRDAGYDVVRLSAYNMQEASDDYVLRKAIELKRVLVTLDGDFGDWAVLPLRRHTGVIRVKAEPTSTEVICGVLLPFLRRHAETSFENRLVIVKPPRVRWIRTADSEDEDTG